MRRFRLRRRRVAAVALLPLAATGAATALAEPADKKARIDASNHSVRLGQSVKLRGAFPETSGAPIEIRHRAKGARSWETVSRARTGASGRYKVRVTPRSNGYWRAELASDAPPPVQQAQPGEPTPTSAPSADGDTGAERIMVRSRTKARVSDHHTLAGRKVKVRGKVAPAGAKRRVVVEIGKAREVTSAGRDGRFEVAWSPPDTGTYRVDVKARSNRIATGSRDSAGRLTAYRQASASWYGPGLYGNSMACGGTLTPSTMGVAHKTMKCGTKLRLRHGGKSVTVRVVDRGPYAGDREFDLTEATKEALGFGELGTVLSSK